MSFLFGPQVLKLYAWEESFMKKIKLVRKKELKYSRNSGLWGAGFMFTFGCAPTLVSNSLVKISRMRKMSKIRQ